MKRSEAKTKWCPAFQHAGIEGKCAADQCMAWRWNISPPLNETSGEDLGDGYCGLAGPMAPLR